MGLYIILEMMYSLVTQCYTMIRYHLGGQERLRRELWERLRANMMSIFWGKRRLTPKKHFHLAVLWQTSLSNVSLKKHICVPAQVDDTVTSLFLLYYISPCLKY